MAKTIVKQTIYKYEQGDETKENTWTIEELRNRVINSDSINDYYLKKWVDFESNMKKTENLKGEKWRRVPWYKRLQVFASNKGRIKINETIVTSYYENNIYNERKALSRKLLETVGTKNKVGYLIAQIPGQTKFLEPYVYQMVADAWLKDYTYDPDSKTNGQIHHITNDGYDNRPENLIFVSSDEHNQIHFGKKDNNYQPGKYDKK